MDEGRELTPWEEINPPMVLGRQVERHWLSQSSYVERVVSSEVLAELTKSLALVAPVGMTEDDRTQWLAVAVDTIADMLLSPSTFHDAVRRARSDADCGHPAKILPAIAKIIGNWEPTVIDNRPESAQAVERRRRNDEFRALLERIRTRQLSQDEIDGLSDHAKSTAHAELILSTDYAGAWFYPGTRKGNG